MPYIKQENRKKFDFAPQHPTHLIKRIVWNIDNSGELNYVLSTILSEYIEERREQKLEVNYEFLNSIVGVLECCKQEFYRRVIVPFEDKKIAENDDVY